MHVDLTDEQAEELGSVLNIALRDLSYEIASADLPSFRQSLRHRREILRDILGVLEGAVPTAQTTNN